jgi:hypothetical protein
MCRGINEFQKGYQLTTNLVKAENDNTVFQHALSLLYHLTHSFASTFNASLFTISL